MTLPQPGKYTIERTIAVRAAGSAHFARDVESNRPVSLELLRPELTCDDQRQVRFLRAASNAAEIAHPNVVGVLEAGIDAEGAAFLVSEWVEGTTLAELLRTSGPLSVTDACEVLLQVLAALDAAHAHGVVHGTLKPSTVLITSGEPWVKVADFGMLHDDDGAAAEPGARRTPEHACGLPLDPRSDVFLAAALLYELLSGQVAFDAPTDAESRQRLLLGRTEPLEQLAPHVPTQLAQLIARALSPVPEFRPSSAIAFAEELSEFARPPSEDESERSSLLSPPLLGFPSLEPRPTPLPLALPLDDDALEQPVFPRPPIAPRMDAVSLGLPAGTPLPVEEEILSRRLPTIRAERDAQPRRRPKPRLGEAPVLWALAGFAGGLVSLWLAGVF